MSTQPAAGSSCLPYSLLPGNLATFLYVVPKTMPTLPTSPMGTIPLPSLAEVAPARCWVGPGLSPQSSVSEPLCLCLLMLPAGKRTSRCQPQASPQATAAVGRSQGRVSSVVFSEEGRGWARLWCACSVCCGARCAACIKMLTLPAAPDLWKVGWGVLTTPECCLCLASTESDPPVVLAPP